MNHNRLTAFIVRFFLVFFPVSAELKRHCKILQLFTFKYNCENRVKKRQVYAINPRVSDIHTQLAHSRSVAETQETNLAVSLVTEYRDTHHYIP